MKKHFLLFFVFGIIVCQSQIITTVAGNGSQGYSGDGGNATNAKINLPHGVASDAIGNIFFADRGNYVIRKVNTIGKISTIAGNGTSGYSGDGGLATLAQISSPFGVTVDKVGNIYFADQYNNRIRKIDASGIITTVAGNGSSSSSGDGGPATSAAIYSPTSLTFDVFGNMYIAEYLGNKVRKVNTAGIISTVAGAGPSGFSGDGGPAINAQLRYPIDVETDCEGNLYIVDVNNVRIRKVNSSGIISTIIGNGTNGFAGDGGPATQASFSFLTDMVLDHEGNIYLADNKNHRIRKVDTQGTISTFAGNSSFAYNGDGILATAASLFNPYSVGVDASGNIYISDTNEDRVRKVSLNCSTPDLSIVSVNPYICEGKVNTIYACGAGKYTWNPGGYNTQIITVSPESTTIYTVTASTGSCTTTQTISVEVKNKPNLSISSDTVVCTPNYVVHSSSTASSYLWNNGNSNPSISINTSGSYWVIVTDNFGCTNSDTTNITINTPPFIDILHDTMICSNTTTSNLNLNATYPNTSAYLWNDNYTEPIHTIDSEGMYWVHYFLDNTCEVIDSFNYSIENIPEINLINDTTLCKSFILQAPANMQYNWNTGLTSQEITIDSSGIYSVIITSSEGCINSDTTLVVINTPPQIQILKDTLECGASFTHFIINAQYPNTITYNWNDGQIGPIHSIENIGIYWVDFSLSNTCIVRDSFTVNFHTTPVTNLGPDTTFCLGNLTLNTYTSNYTYLWSTGEISPDITVTTAGVYWVEVNNNGCLYADTLIIKPDLNKLNFIMPNILTPNGDGINDVIDFSENQFNELQFTIYNRWGNKLFESNDAKCIWKPILEDGTYFYTLQYNLECGTANKKEYLKGFIHLIQ